MNQRRRAWRRACLVGLLCAVSAQAHVYAPKTLRGLVGESDVVLRARIVASDAGPLASTEPAGLGRPAVEATVLEVFKGPLEAPVVRFAQHGHGVAQFEPGEEALLFLVDIERSRELEALARTGAFEWVSLQEHGDEFPLAPATREVLFAAVRSYVEAGDAAASTEVALRAMRQATLALLGSGNAKLAASALRDLVAMPGAPLIGESDLPQLKNTLGDPHVSMGVRVGLLIELERRELLDGRTYWRALLSDENTTRDRVVAIRAAGSSGGDATRGRLIELLGDADEQVAAAAAAALGSRHNAAAIAPLAETLASHGSSNVRFAAIRGLGGIDLPAARAALEKEAKSNPDPATRRRALAALRKSAAASGSGTTAN